MLFRSKQSGFTLIELMIVLTILGVCAGIAIPNLLSYMPKYRLNGAARQVMADLMWARMQAVSQNNRFRVFFSTNHEYKILDDDDNDNEFDNGEWTQTQNIQQEYSNVTFSATANPIFYPKGTALGATITITSSADSNLKKYVKVASTGRVKIDDTLD